MLIAATTSRNESKLQDTLEKLLYYMQKSEKAGIVPQDEIEADIEYLEGDHQDGVNKGSFRHGINDPTMESKDEEGVDVEQMVLAQCLSIEALLDDNNRLKSFSN